MNESVGIVETMRARLAPHGLFLRGILHFDGDGPFLSEGRRAGTVMLIGNVGSSIWPAFSSWHAVHSEISDPLDEWSKTVINPIAEEISATPWFPSEKPWQPFQQWAMRAEGLRASPLGVLIHPEYGLWHGYRGALGFADRVGEATVPFTDHPCEHCPDKPCLKHCPVDAVSLVSFDVTACRSHLHAAEGRRGCMTSGCIARNACPVGSRYRYSEGQLRFHMAALA
jgi:ferredoxin